MANKINIDTTQLGIEWTTGTSYSVSITPALVKEVDGNRSLSKGQPNIVSFTTPNDPVRTQFSPSTNAVDIVLPQFTITFDQNISKNIGNFYLYQVDTTDILISTISVLDSKVTLTGQTLTIDLSQDGDIFVGEATYYLLYDAGIVTNLFNFDVAALTNVNLIRFTYRTKPVITAVSPVYGSTSTFVSNIAITYNRPIQKGVGTVYLYRDTNPDIVFFAQPVSTSSITIVGSTATVSLNLPEDHYYLIYDYGVFKDLNSIKVNSINDDTVVNFTQKCVSGLSNRTYYINNETTFFNGTTPLILDTDTTASYTITLSTTLGEFADDEYGTNRSMNWTYTGTKSQVNAKFSNIRFFPTKNTNSTGTYTYTQSKGNLLQVNRTFDLAASIQTLLLTTSTYTFTSAGTWTPLYKYTKYGFADILVVGGGGAGSAGYPNTISIPHKPGSGGGGGGVIELLNSTVTQKTYSISVGAGGAGNNTTSGTNGGNSTFDIYTAYGGQGGQRVIIDGEFFTRGGSSGAPTTNTAIANGPGGGAGAGASVESGYDGGAGLVSAILGSYVADGGGMASILGSPEGFGGSGGTGGRGAKVPTAGPTVLAGAGTTNRGGGGGGGANVPSKSVNAPGGAGGSGIVIVRAHPEVEPTTLLSISLNPYSYARYKANGSDNDQLVTATISVAGVYYTNKPTGVVTLLDNSLNVLGTATLVVSTSTTVASANISWNPIAVGQTTGTNTITAIYNGDGFNKASSATQYLSIYNPTFEGVLTVDSSSAFTGGTRSGQHVGPVTLTATFANTSFAPSTVSFYREGNVLLGTTSTSAGVATLTVELPVGNRIITTVFSPTTIYKTTNSLSITITSGGRLAITSAVRTPPGYTYQSTGQYQEGVIDVNNNGSLTVTMTLTVPDLAYVPAKYKSNLLTGSGAIAFGPSHYNDSVLYQTSGNQVVITYSANYTHNNNIAGTFVGISQYFSYSSNPGMFVIGGNSNATFLVPIHILR